MGKTTEGGVMQDELLRLQMEFMRAGLIPVIEPPRSYYWVVAGFFAAWFEIVGWLWILGY